MIFRITLVRQLRYDILFKTQFGCNEAFDEGSQCMFSLRNNVKIIFNYLQYPILSGTLVKVLRCALDMT